LVSATAVAQSDAAKKQAQALQVEGLALLQKGDARAALQKFDEAFRLVASPKILFNRGKAHRALGQDVEALADYERFLDEAPYAPKESRAEAERTVAALRPKLSYLEIQTDDVGSTIAVDGREIGTAPLARPVVVLPGTHEIRMAKSGMNDDTRSVSPIAGQKLRVVVKLTPVVASAPPPPVAPPVRVPPPDVVPVTPPSKQTDGDGVPPPPPPPPAREQSWQITAAWVAAGAGALFLGTGITAQLLSSSKYDEFNNTRTTANPSGQCNKALAQSGGGPCQGIIDAADLRKSISIAGYAAAGVSLVGALVLYLTAPSSSAGHEVAAACAPDPRSGISCALTLRF
jgi:hypothetical protein